MDQVVKLVSELRASNSTNAKKALLAQHAQDQEVKEFFLYTLDPYRMFNLTSKNIKPVAGPRHLHWTTARTILNQLQAREITGNAALALVNDFLAGMDPEHANLFLSILDKDPAAGVAAKLINSVFEDLIPQFEVQRCESFEDFENYELPYGTNTLGSRKLDGLRVIAIKREDGKGFRFFSREGNEFLQLANLKTPLDKFYEGMPSAVLDGEVCIVDKDGKEDFKQISSEMKRKNHTIERPKYILFDLLTLDAFDSGSWEVPFGHRYDKLKRLMGNQQSPYWEVLEQKVLGSPDELKAMVDEASKNGWEGLILKNNVAPYEGKRTKNMLKVKTFHDHEFKIVGTVEGKGHFQGMLGALMVEGEYKGKPIKSEVGSGFKQAFIYKDNQPDYSNPDPEGDRMRFWRQRDQLVGQVVTIKFFEVSQNKEGTYSLRFPVFKVLHGEKRTM